MASGRGRAAAAATAAHASVMNPQHTQAFCSVVQACSSQNERLLDREREKSENDNLVHDHENDGRVAGPRGGHVTKHVA